jgi:hypothetical protein
MLQVPNATAQLMAGSLFRCGILCFEGRIRGDVLRHVFGPNDFFGVLLSWGSLPLSMALGFFSSEDRGGNEK